MCGGLAAGLAVCVRGVARGTLTVGDVVSGGDDVVITVRLEWEMPGTQSHPGPSNKGGTSHDQATEQGLQQTPPLPCIVTAVDVVARTPCVGRANGGCVPATAVPVRCNTDQ